MDIIKQLIPLLQSFIGTLWYFVPITIFCMSFGLKLTGTKKPELCRASKSSTYNVLLVEPSGIEPLTSTLPVLRSPS